MKVVLFNVLVVLGILLLFEGAIRLFGLAEPSGSGLERAITREIPHPELGVVGNPAFHEHDRRGFRNELALDQAEFVVVGDSHVYGTGVTSPQKWSAVLEELTGNVGYNVSFGGFSPFRNMDNFALSMTLGPSTIFYGLYFGNDLYDDFYHFYRNFGLEDCGGLSHCTTALEAENMDPSREELRELTRGLFGRGARDGDPSAGDRSRTTDLKRNLSRHLATYEVLRTSRNAVRDRARRSPRTLEAVLERIPAGLREMACPVAGRWSSIMTAYYRGHVIDEENPRIKFGYELTERTLLGFAEEAQDAAIDFYVVLLPSKEFVFEHAGIDVGECAGMDELLRGERHFRARLIAVLEARGVSYIDPLPRLIGSTESPYFDGLDGHPNAIGHRIIAESVREAAFGTPDA